MQASPLQKVLDQFGDDSEDPTEARKAAKKELVKAVRDLVQKGDLLEDDFSDKGIERLSNRKLLKLLEVAEHVRDEFGSRSGLIDKTLELEGRQKDSGFREHLEAKRLPELFSFYKASDKRSRS